MYCFEKKKCIGEEIANTSKYVSWQRSDCGIVFCFVFCSQTKMLKATYHSHPPCKRVRLSLAGVDIMPNTVFTSLLQLKDRNESGNKRCKICFMYFASALIFPRFAQIRSSVASTFVIKDAITHRKIKDVHTHAWTKWIKRDRIAVERTL